MKRLIAAILLFLYGVPAIGAPPPGIDPSSPLARWYNGLLTPGPVPTPCCGPADCRQRRAVRDGDRWFMENDAGQLLPVPPEAILDDAPYDGVSAYGCVYGGVVRCFIPPRAAG